MRNARVKELPEAVERVRDEFETWRRSKNGRERIPERLWSAACVAARRHGVYAVSQAARLEAATLKRRMDSRGGSAAFEFVELEGSPGGVECIVELEKSNGTRMRICVRDGATVDWGRLKEAFLGG